MFAGCRWEEPGETLKHKSKKERDQSQALKDGEEGARAQDRNQALGSVLLNHEAEVHHREQRPTNIQNATSLYILKKSTTRFNSRNLVLKNEIVLM